ncbi:hypothetical protein [Psychrobacillus sp. FSL H8-0510]|uniref:hypothetical protein n=1 Tax=Psychrobacillus sp. FSL H8-0510 TaxID=2921394 RepID=UPI0030F562E7
MSNTEDFARDELYQSLVINKHFLYLFDLIQQINLQGNVYFEQTEEDPEHLWSVQDKITEYIMEECNLYKDEYDLFLEMNNLSRDTPTNIVEKIKIEVGFDSNYASRDHFDDLLSHYASGNSEHSKEQIIKQLIFWEQNILFSDIEHVDFHYKEPIFKTMNFKLMNE